MQEISKEILLEVGHLVISIHVKEDRSEMLAKTATYKDQIQARWLRESKDQMAKLRE